MTIEIVGDLEREERRHANHDGPEDLITDIKIVVRVAAALVSQNAMVGIFGGKLGNADAERRALLHALEDEINSVGVVLHHPAQSRHYVVFLADAFLGPFDGQFVIAGIRLHPTPVHLGTLAQHGLIDHRNTRDIAEEIHDLLGPR